MMKRKTFWILLPLLLALILGCGTVTALMYRQTSSRENKFDIANVDCEVSETFDGTYKSSIQVKNTSNINAYIRVRLVTYWVKMEDGNPKIVAKEPSPSIDFTLASGWKDRGDNTYFYETPIAPNASTPNLLDSPIVLAQDGEYLQVVEVFADAIQSEPASAVKEAWGIG